MWRIKKIYHHDTKSGMSYVMLQKNSKPTKNKNSDIIRCWFLKNYPDKREYPEVLLDKKLGRLTYWLGGNTESKAFEDEIIKLMEESGEKISVYKPPTHEVIMAYGWLPCILPTVTYDLTFKDDKNQSTELVQKLVEPSKDTIGRYYITGIDWVNVAALDGKKLGPFIDYFCSKLPKKKISSGQLRAFVKSRWRHADWTTIDRTNYKVTIMKWLLSNQTEPMLIGWKTDLVKSIFYTYMELPLKSMLFMKFNWLQTKIPLHRDCDSCNRTIMGHKKCVVQLLSTKHAEIKSKWERINTKPESILLQGEDYLPTAGINDYKRLCTVIGRELPDDDELTQLEDANDFIKGLCGRSCVGIENSKRTASTKYVHKVGANWATQYDIANTKSIMSWLEGIPIYTNRNVVISDKLNTQVVLKHPDDKMHWWSVYSYGNVSLERTEDTFIIGNAHNFVYDDWVGFSRGPKPIAIFGRTDMKPGVFADYAYRFHRLQLQMYQYPMCDKITVVSYVDACSRSWPNAQVFVSTKDEKTRYRKFPPATKLKRKWMYNPRRVVTESVNDGYSIWVTESDGTEHVRHSIMNNAYSDANIICTWESYQMVDTAVLICTDATKARDVYLARACAKKEVILVETDGVTIDRHEKSADLSRRASLINI
jgi:hypothetical protein